MIPDEELSRKLEQFQDRWTTSTMVTTPEGHEYRVSTVDLVFDHPGGNYETMVFAPDSWSDLFMKRYTTQAEAEIGHATTVELLQDVGHWALVLDDLNGEEAVEA